MRWTVIRKRALAAYVGFAVGDALGATTEFMRPGEIQTRYKVHQEITGGGWLHLKPGQVTDDTQMSLALGEALLETGGVDEQVIASHFVDWMCGKPADIGHTIRQALSKFKMFGQTQADYSKYASSNGAVMRNLPVILATVNFPELLDEWSIRQSLITHNNNEALLGTLFLSRIAQQVIIYAQEAPLKQLCNCWFERHPRFDYKRYKRSIDGYIIDTLRTVLFFFFNTSDFESCLVGIVNAGGDTDTNAALAGMLAGPFYGLESIPRRWVKKMDRQIMGSIHKQVIELMNRFWDAGSAEVA